MLAPNFHQVKSGTSSQAIITPNTWCSRFETFWQMIFIAFQEVEVVSTGDPEIKGHSQMLTLKRKAMHKVTILPLKFIQCKAPTSRLFGRRCNGRNVDSSTSSRNSPCAASAFFQTWSFSARFDHSTDEGFAQVFPYVKNRASLQ